MTLMRTALLQMTTSSRPCAGTHTPCVLASAVWRMPFLTTHARGYGSRRGSRDDLGGLLGFIFQTATCAQTWFRVLATASARALQIHRPPKRRGRREDRVRAAPAVSCAKVDRKAHTSIQVQRKHSGLPCAMVLQLISCSPRRDHSLFVTVIPKKRELLKNLTPAIGASGPHDFAVHVSCARQSQLSRPSHPTARFVTCATPLSSGGTGELLP